MTCDPAEGTDRRGTPPGTAGQLQPPWQHRPHQPCAAAAERNYVSRLARDLGISRALLQVHLRKLEAAGLVSASVEVSADGKAMKFYEVAPFALHLTPDTIRIAARTLSTDRELEAELR